MKNERIELKKKHDMQITWGGVPLFCLQLWLKLTVPDVYVVFCELGENGLPSDIIVAIVQKCD